MLLPGWLTLGLLALASGLLGWLAAGLFGREPANGNRFFPLFERGFVALALGMALLGWIAFTLAEWGWYSLPALAAIWLALITLLLLWQKRSPAPLLSCSPTPPPFSRWEPLFLAAWFIIALWLFFRPHEFILGGADAGVYVNLAAAVAENGRFLLDDPTLSQLDPALYPALLRQQPVNPVADYYLFPAFFVAAAEGPTILPQFYHLHPMWQAIAYGLGGVGAALLLTGLWALLGSLAVYLTVRQLAGGPAAALALTGLSINALQPWFARYPTTEPLTQYLLWTGLWSAGAWLGGRQPRALWALLAGLSLGQVFLVRIDFYFIWLVVGLLAIWQWGSGRLRRADGWFYLPFILLTIHSLLHALTQSRPYFYELFGYGLNLLGRNGLIPATAVFLGLLMLLLLGRYRNRLGQLARWRRPTLLVGVGLLLLLGVYGWFIRPLAAPAAGYLDWYSTNQIPRFDQENLVRLGWYLAPLGVWLGILGVSLLLWRVERRSALLVGVGLLLSLLYLWRIQTNPHHIYTMRRYVPVTLPLAMAATAVWLLWLARLRRPLSLWLAGGVSLLWLGGLGWLAQGFISQVDYPGLVNQLDTFSAQFEPEAILIFNDAAPIGQGDTIGTPLKFLHGLDVFTLREPAALDTAVFAHQLAQWQAEGHKLYWMATAEGHPWPLTSWEVVPLDAYHLATSALEGRYDRRPTAVLPREWSGTIMQIRQAAHE